MLHKVPSGKLQDYRKKKNCYFLFLLSYSNFLLSEKMCNSAHSKSKMCESELAHFLRNFISISQHNSTTKHKLFKIIVLSAEISHKGTLQSNYSLVDVLVKELFNIMQMMKMEKMCKFRSIFFHENPP